MSTTPLESTSFLDRVGDQIPAVFGALVLLASCAVPAYGQDSSGLAEVSLFGEEEFTIRAATKTEIPISKAPSSVSVISAQQIKESGARTIPELLRLVAGVNVRWNPMVQSIDIRAFGQNPFTSRVLLLIDGVPYNSWNKGGFPQHPGFDFFMLQNIKRIEVVRGPGSSLYGENAYWGVINIVTLSGEDLQGGRVEVFGGDLESASLGAIYGKTVGDDGSFLFSARAQNGQLPMNFWIDQDSEVEGLDIFLKGKYKNVELSYYRHEDELDGFEARFESGVFRSSDTVSQSVDILAFKTSHEFRNGITFDADVSYAQRDGSACGSCHALPQNEPVFQRELDHGSQLIGDFRLGLQPIPSHDILIGVEARRVDTGDHVDVDTVVQPGQVTDYTKLAAYVQDRISLADDKVNLLLGARYDDSNDLFDSEWSPRVALVYNPNDKIVVRGGWSTAFRFPNFSELYQDSFFVNVEAPFGVIPFSSFGRNPDLEPEEIRTFDLGFEYRVSSAFSAKLDLYHSELKNFIVIVSQGGLVVSENHPDEATIDGAELELRFRPNEKLTGFLNIAYQEQDQDGVLTDSSGKPFEFVYAPETKVNLGTYFGPFAGFRGAIEVQYRDSRLGPSQWNFAGTGTVELDDYTVVNARLSWDAPIRIGNSSEGLRFSLYGKNLTDEEYAETFLPIDMQLPGATYYGAIELRY
ncbi:MAG: TonB-dependent receptor [Thermoanaerobaculia bacterium]|nr:TonB-dependent receptor [Thermoanaerobaculia bacterium]